MPASETANTSSERVDPVERHLEVGEGGVPGTRVRLHAEMESAALRARKEGLTTMNRPDRDDDSLA